MSESFIFSIGAVVLGAIAGSFLNALSFRYNTGRSMAGRSRCMQCGHTLAARDLVPILSYFFLQGKCRFCRSELSIQYVLVEIAAAGTSYLIYSMFPDPVVFGFWFVVWMTLLFTLIYDLRHTIIPWSCSILLAVLSLYNLLFVVPISTDALWAGPLLAFPLFLLSLVSKGRWMGWGDSALEISLGWFLGLSMGLTALMLAFWSGALVGILLILLKSRFTMKSEIPFAPFLVFGAFITFFFHVDFFSTISYFF